MYAIQYTLTQWHGLLCNQIHSQIIMFAIYCYKNWDHIRQSLLTQWPEMSNQPQGISIKLQTVIMSDCPQHVPACTIGLKCISSMWRAHFGLQLYISFSLWAVAVSEPPPACLIKSCFAANLLYKCIPSIGSDLQAKLTQLQQLLNLCCCCLGTDRFAYKYRLLCQSLRGQYILSSLHIWFAG